MDFLKTPDTVSAPIGSTSTGGAVTRQGLLVDGTSPTNASKNYANYYNMLLEEIYYVITQAGIVPDKDNWHQLHQAIQTLSEVSSRKAGVILPFAGSVAPSGTLLTNGAEYSRTTYQSLFNVIGTTYGAGNGSSTFNVPDLRGLFLRGLDAGRGVDSGRSLGSLQGDAIRNITAYLNALQLSPNIVSGVSGFGGAIVSVDSGVNGNDSAGGATNVNISFDASRVVPTASENRPINMALNFVIVY